MTWIVDNKPNSAKVHVTVETEPPTLTVGDAYYPSFTAVFTLFILAVLFESGLAILFNWRPFTDTFHSRGAKPLIAFLVSYFFVSHFKLDIVTSLVNIYTKQGYGVNPVGEILTAMIVAGGSSGVNNLLQALGFREISKPAASAPKPPPQHAWVSVRLNRKEAVGPVDVLVTEVKASGGTVANPSVVGTIQGGGKMSRLFGFFLKDRSRFPPELGYAVQPGSYEVGLAGRDRTGQSISSNKWGPYDLIAGAIVDLEQDL